MEKSDPTGSKQQTDRELKLENVSLSEIVPDPEQPRKYFNEEALEELANSIKKHGVLQPIILRGEQGKKALIVAGERRYQAAKRIGLETIPAIFTDGNAVEISIVENLLREDLTPIEEAEALQRLIEVHGYKQNQLTVVIGKAESTISEMLSLNQLPDEIKEECRSSSEYSRGMFLKIMRKHKQKRSRIKAFEKHKDEKSKEQEEEKGTKTRRANAEIFLSGIQTFSKNLGAWSEKDMSEDEVHEVQSALLELVEEVEKILAK